MLTGASFCLQGTGYRLRLKQAPSSFFQIIFQIIFQINFSEYFSDYFSDYFSEYFSDYFSDYFYEVRLSWFAFVSLPCHLPLLHFSSREVLFTRVIVTYYGLLTFFFLARFSPEGCSVHFCEFHKGK